MNLKVGSRLGRVVEQGDPLAWPVRAEFGCLGEIL